jgi:8-oxo-dGTP diphosphatase
LTDHPRGHDLPGLLAPVVPLDVDDGRGGRYALLWDRVGAWIADGARCWPTWATEPWSATSRSSSTPPPAAATPCATTSPPPSTPTPASWIARGNYAHTVAGMHHRLQRLLRRIGLGRPAPARRAVKPRAVAVVVNDDQVLVMKRHKRGRDYAVLPGGGVEEGETAAEAALRELHEETTLVAEVDRLLWTGRHNDRPAWYFLMTAVRGRAELSGPEALANRSDNSFERAGHRRPAHRARPTPARHPRPTRRAAHRPPRPDLTTRPHR